MFGVPHVAASRPAKSPRSKDGLTASGGLKMTKAKPVVKVVFAPFNTRLLLNSGAGEVREKVPYTGDAPLRA